MRGRDLVALSTPEARLLVLPTGLGLVAAVGPDRLSRSPSLCVNRRVFGRCPTCGVTRAMAALLRGDTTPRRRRGLGALVLATLGAVLVTDARRVLRRPHQPTPIGVSTLIDAPADHVWEELQDIASHAAWMEDALAIRFTSEQQQGVGTTFEADTKVGPFRLSDPMEVTEWEEGRSMGIRHGGVVSGTGRFRLEPTGMGGTRFTWEEALSFPWWMGGRAGSLAAGQVLGVMWRRNLANLKRRVESR